MYTYSNKTLDKKFYNGARNQNQSLTLARQNTVQPSESPCMLI